MIDCIKIQSKFTYLGELEALEVAQLSELADFERETIELEQELSFQICQK
ncbi:14879_t:CDS:2 [Funneliformis mosseae]|uniref:14879_t:CDS:1 n=1 Tax=Funneliformis mosseae TaxID=27381 RepID=A0A9N8Z1J5_FUNMO|nr:14879_t:CDS:2 [Funneliformis mosseae]